MIESCSSTLATAMGNGDKNQWASHLQTTIHQVVNEWLGDPIDEKNLEKAFDTLVACCNGKYHMVDHVEVLCDMYRALLVTSFLLRLEYRHSPEVSQCLEDSVERCFLLLQILVAAPTPQDLVHKMPTSRYPLLNALLEEPLIPMCPTDRQELWLSESNDDDEEDEEGVFLMPDKKQLASEEEQLLDMARRPIPEQTQDVEGNNVYRQTQPHRKLLPNDILVEDGGCKLYRCGVLQLEDKTFSLSTESVVNVENSSIHLTLGDGTCMHVPIQKRQDWKVALEATRQHLTIQVLLRSYASTLWT
jgi:hypothetical protein